MGLSFSLFILSLAFLTGVSVVTGTLHQTEGCVDLGVQSEQEFTITGEAAQLNCSMPQEVLLHPHRVSWYRGSTGTELAADERWLQAQEHKVWLLSSRLQDTGYYTCVLRTADQCFTQTSMLIVNDPEDCGQPVQSTQTLVTIANGLLRCPLPLSNVTGYTLQWYKGCEPLVNGDKFLKVNKEMLVVQHVTPSDEGNYTCRATFNVMRTVVRASETIRVTVADQWNMRPWVSEPNNESIKANPGSPFNKTCRVFVPGRGEHTVDIMWALHDFVSSNTSERISQLQLNRSRVENGEWMEVVLNFAEVKEEDFYSTYRCMVFNDKGLIIANFTLLPTDPDHLLSVGLLFGVPGLIFLVFVVLWRTVRIEVVLWFRGSFPCLYTDPGCDGKLYDAYVAYPRSGGAGVCKAGDGISEAMEEFVFSTLPQVLEGQWGYKLFIMGRDSLPGEAEVEAVQRNIGQSRRLLLLYSPLSYSNPDTAQNLEQQLALHTALVQGNIPAVLVELGGTVGSELLPESLLYLRGQQGVVRWGRSGGRWAAEGGWAAARFWKHLCYHMPVRSRLATSPQKKQLLLTV